MNHNRSVATIDAPEFINLSQDALNPGISKCEIKVLYLGKNRNGSYINKETAIEMANSLPGTPIVGVFKKDLEDFGDHGNIIHIENGEIEFACSTIPYGFVAPDAKVWFQNFVDTNEFGEEIQREYLMTTGYLWTGQFEEVASCIEDGKGQSMELDEETLQGHWATDDNTGVEFFIINDAIFSKLCILGDDVEPCFEGASITGPEVSKNFAYNKEFSQTLFTMMHELKDVLQNKGGSDMPPKEEVIATEETEQVEAVEETSIEESAEEVEESVSDAEEAVEESDADEAEEETEFALPKEKKEEVVADEEDAVEEEEEKKDFSAEKKDKKSQCAAEEPVEEEEEKKPSVNHELEIMQQELEELRAFKRHQENLEKDAMINKYHMLSNEDKAEIIAHKEEYSLEQIEEKLALVYVRKNVDFSTLTGEKQEEVETKVHTTTYSVDNTVAGVSTTSGGSTPSSKTKSII